MLIGSTVSKTKQSIERNLHSNPRVFGTSVENDLIEFSAIRPIWRYWNYNIFDTVP